MRKLAALAAIGMVTLTAHAAAQTPGLSGTWAGRFVQPNGGSNPIQLNLTQKGTALTGTMGPSANRQWPIEKGEVTGAKATFEVHQGGAVHRFTLTLDKDKLQGEMRTEVDGQTITSKVDVERKVGAVSSAEGFSGTWEGTFVEAHGDSNPILLNLTQTGATLTGTQGPNASRQWAIEKGEVSGTKATFEVRQGGAVHRFTLTLAKDRLQGEMRSEINGQTHISKVDVARAR
jgi:hypothetical protein